jgi:hypothetical protein
MMGKLKEHLEGLNIDKIRMIATKLGNSNGDLDFIITTVTNNFETIFKTIQ